MLEILGTKVAGVEYGILVGILVAPAETVVGHVIEGVVADGVALSDLADEVGLTLGNRPAVTLLIIM